MGRVIPVQNIYYLLLYAWNGLPEGKIIDVSGVVSPDLPNLFAKVLIEGVHQLQRRGLDRQYVQNDEDLMRPRGRMLLGDTIRRGLLSRVQVACSIDDLSHDVLHNQIIKSTLEKLARTHEIDSGQKDAIVGIVRSLDDIRSIAVTVSDFGRIQLHGNNAFYGLLLRVCALVHEALMPEPGSGRFLFRDVLSDPQTMGLIFQDFIRNFFVLEQTEFAVKGESFRWPVDEHYGYGHGFMPVMYTDTSLLSKSHAKAIIIECKWTPITLQRGKLRSEHLYQLNSYMRCHSRACKSLAAVEGLLLYPLVDEPVDVAVRINGQRMRVRTIDLTTDWPNIRHQLLDLLQDQPLDCAPNI
jgi:5-methylcytosine-specific restriction enzyme subunit McrC